MRSSILVVALWVFALGVATPSSFAEERTSWKAGLAKTRITPDKSLWMGGFGARTNTSSGTLQELHAKALALDDGSGRPAVLVPTDLVGFRAAVGKNIAERVEKQFGLPRARLILNSSHTHSGPLLADPLSIWYKWRLSDPQYRDVEDYTRELEDKVVAVIGAASPRELQAAAAGPLSLITFEPGHFHAALFQKEMLPGVSAQVHVYAPVGPDLLAHLKRIAEFNGRAETPTHWQLEVHAGPDGLQRMLSEKPGNVVVLSGNNRGKIDRIEAMVRAGLHVLADKPWIIELADVPKLQAALDTAEQQGVVAFDAMTQRFEITCLLQRELVNLNPALQTTKDTKHTKGETDLRRVDFSRWVNGRGAASPSFFVSFVFFVVPTALSRVNDRDLFGTCLEGSVSEPAVHLESVHYLLKEVAGVPMLRPVWFFDIRQQGEGLADVGTHLVDLVQWTLFPEQAIDYGPDLHVLRGERWPTVLAREQFQRVTGERDLPDFLDDWRSGRQAARSPKSEISPSRSALRAGGRNPKSNRASARRSQPRTTVWNTSATTPSFTRSAASTCASTSSGTSRRRRARRTPSWPFFAAASRASKCGKEKKRISILRCMWCPTGRSNELRCTPRCGIKLRPCRRPILGCRWKSSRDACAW